MRNRPSAPRVQPIEKVAARVADRTMYGVVRPVNLTATLAHNREVANVIASMAGTFFDAGVLDPRLRELIILRMGWDTRSAYEFGQHVVAARTVGISDAEIRLTTRPVDDGDWTLLEHVALRMVDDLHRDDCVTDGVWRDLRALVDDRTAIAMVALACCYRMVAGVLNSLGVQPEPDLPGWPAGVDPG